MAFEVRYGGSRNRKDIDTNRIVGLSARVQNALSASGSQQIIGPLDWDTVYQAITEERCFILIQKNEGEMNSAGLCIGCAFIRSLPSDFLVLPSLAKDLANAEDRSYPTPWWLLHAVMLEPNLQGKGWGVKLLTGVIKLMKARLDISPPTTLSSSLQVHRGTIFPTCWSGNGKLRDFYTRVGFKFLDVMPKDNYEVAVFSLSLDDYVFESV